MRVLIVGCGSIGSRRAKIAKKLGHEVVVFDTAKYQALKLSSVLDVGMVGSAGDGYDAWLICTPADSHLDYLAMAIHDFGTHVFVEKPLALDVGWARHVCSLLDRSPVRTMVACNMRFQPGLMALKMAIKLGEIGLLLALKLEMGQNLDSSHKPYHMRQETGGGVILDSIHELDLAYWLAGSITSVCAIHNGVVPHAVETVAAVVLKHESEVISEIHLDHAQTKPVRTVSAIGTRGRIDWAYEGEAGMYEAELRHFFDCIENGKEPMNGLDEAEHVLEKALEARG